MLRTSRYTTAIGFAVGLAGVARGDSFDEYGATAPATASLSERTCDLELALRGAVVTAELRQRIANTGPIAVAASLGFELPRGAVITGLTTDGLPAIGVAASSRTLRVDAPDVLGADPALLVAESDGHYRLTLQPIAPGRDVAVTTRWSALAEVSGGALHLVLPGRTAERLTTCHATLRVTPGPGTTIDALELDGHPLRTHDRASFGLDDHPLAIDVELGFGSRREPVVWLQREAIGDDWTATLATVVAPPARATIAAHRALLVIDGSRSMALVGKPTVTKLVRAIAQALPAGTELDAIVYDRTATRVLGDWRAASPASLQAIEAAIAGHAPSNGSDLVGAFALAHRALADGTPALVVVITDGVLGDVADGALTGALAAAPHTVELHAIVIDPGTTHPASVAALQRPISHDGGSLVEVSADGLDAALAGIGGWLRPAWLDVALGDLGIPTQLLVGGGGSYSMLQRGAPSLTLTSKLDPRLRIAAGPAPQAAVAALVLASTQATDATRSVRQRAEAAHPVVTADRALAVVTAIGKVAASRRAMIQGGGEYTRMVAVDDLPHETATPAVAASAPSAIAAITLERLFREQLQPRAYVCYQRALGLTPTLVGTAHFDLTIGRGEVTTATVTGLADAGFTACLVDAAYQLTPPPPNFDVNSDDQTIAHYPLTFNTRSDLPVIVLGDADSTSPLDIGAIEGGVPERRRKVQVDATTPLGEMRPSR